MEKNGFKLVELRVMMPLHVSTEHIFDSEKLDVRSCCADEKGEKIILLIPKKND